MDKLNRELEITMQVLFSSNDMDIVHNRDALIVSPRDINIIVRLSDLSGFQLGDDLRFTVEASNGMFVLDRRFYEDLFNELNELNRWQVKYASREVLIRAMLYLSRSLESIGGTVFASTNLTGY